MLEQEFRIEKVDFKECINGWVWQCPPIIPAMWEAEEEGSQIQYLCNLVRLSLKIEDKKSWGAHCYNAPGFNPQYQEKSRGREECFHALSILTINILVGKHLLSTLYMCHVFLTGGIRYIVCFFWFPIQFSFCLIFTVY